VLGLAGCGRLDGGDPGRSSAGSGADAAAPADLTDLAWDAQALEAIGFSPAELAPVAAAAAPAPGSSAAPGTNRGPGDRAMRPHKRLRFWAGRNVLHGEAVVQTDEGLKTVVAQRGAVTAIDATTVTVRSTDGFTLTWTFGDPLRVVERRNQVSPREIAVGTQVGVAGARNGDTVVARLILVPMAR
jgi:hypothetical protein